jgi:hypothetical protein
MKHGVDRISHLQAICLSVALLESASVETLRIKLPQGGAHSNPFRLRSSGGRVELRIRPCCCKITTDVLGSRTICTDADQ